MFCSKQTKTDRLGTRIVIMQLLLSCWATTAFCQSRQDSSVLQLPDQYLQVVSSKTGMLSDKLDKKTSRLLNRLQKQENNLKKKLSKIDSTAASQVFNEADSKYNAFRKNISDASRPLYNAKLDSLLTSIKFLQANPDLMAFASGTSQKVTDALASVNKLKDQFSKADAIKKFLKERKQFLKDQLSKFGFAKELKKFNKEVYYYSQQVAEYKAILKDSKKAERKALELLSKTRLFKDFMRRNSMLASLFNMSGDPNAVSSQQGLAGLQTRAQVNALIQQQIVSGGPGAQQQVSQNLQSAQAQLNQLKEKVVKAGGSRSVDDLPDFKPNNQKTKSFWQRLEYGTNIQNQKASYYFPVTSDIGLSVGYKVNDKSVVGIGASYKVGWGTGWRNISITHQGIGLRTYADVKLKGSFWISGGYEQNYRATFSSFDQLRNMNAWQQSGLIGISKTVSLKSKFFKKTKLQLLWDMLSYDQVPRTQPVLFRVGYNF